MFKVREMTAITSIDSPGHKTNLIPLARPILFLKLKVVHSPLTLILRQIFQELIVVVVLGGLLDDDLGVVG